MAREVLTFETISEVDHGSICVAVDEALVAAYKDMLDRPSVEGARKVTLEVALKPHAGSGGLLDYVATDFNIKKSFPAKGTSVLMAAASDGMQFESDSPDNPDQKTLYEKDDDE